QVELLEAKRAVGPVGIPPAEVSTAQAVLADPRFHAFQGELAGPGDAPGAVPDAGADEAVLRYAARRQPADGVGVAGGEDLRPALRRDVLLTVGPCVGQRYPPAGIIGVRLVELEE